MNRTKFNNEIYTKVKPSEIKQKHKKIECHSVQYRPKIREEEQALQHEDTRSNQSMQVKLQI